MTDPTASPVYALVGAKVHRALYPAASFVATFTWVADEGKGYVLRHRRRRGPARLAEVTDLILDLTVEHGRLYSTLRAGAHDLTAAGARSGASGAYLSGQQFTAGTWGDVLFNPVLECPTPSRDLLAALDEPTGLTFWTFPELLRWVVANLYEHEAIYLASFYSDEYDTALDICRRDVHRQAERHAATWEALTMAERGTPCP